MNAIATGAVTIDRQSKSLPCQTQRSGVPCMKPGRFLVGWPAQMIVCGVHHNVIARMLAKAKKLSAKKVKSSR